MNYSASHARRAVVAACCLASAIPVSGCIAAAPALLMAASAATVGYLGFKTYQTVSGSEVTVEFQDRLLAPQARDMVDQALSMAFWPVEGRTMVLAAEAADAQLSLEQVISPSQSQRVLEQAGVSAGFENLTSRERNAAFQAFANQSGAQLILAMADRGHEQATNMLSLSRPQITYRVDVVLYGASAAEIVWQSELRLIVGLGGNSPSQSELEDVAARAVIDRLVEIKNGQIMSGRAS